ncbi:TonB-dependent receptor [Acidobacteria bacterium AH-259-D05]|nr:TonB-dependent receptor [Acidobacteria bacterium AH-259-D05]
MTGGSSSLTNIGPGGFGFQAWNSYQFGDDFHVTRGRHSLRLGGRVDRILHNFTNATFEGGRYAFNDFPSFVEGISRQFAGYLPGSNVFRGMRTTLIGLYVQDDFRLSPNFTLNLGFRFETMTEANEVNELQSQLTNPLDPAVKVGEPYFERPGQVFHPRIGLAWDIRGDGKTSLRAGAGMFNDVLTGTFWINASVNARPFNAVGTVDNPDPAVFPNAFSLIEASGRGSSIIRDTPDAKLPTRTQWNLTLQQELFPDTVLTVAYTGAVGRHHIRTAEANQAFPTGTVNGIPVWCTDPEAGCVSNIKPKNSRRNPNFGFLLTHMTDANTNYNSLQVSLRKRYSQGLQFLSNYTWGHATDEGSQQWGSEGRNNPQNTTLISDHRFDRGDSIFDVRHSFSFSGIFELPFGSGRRFGSNLPGVANQILGGWEINSILILSSGNPFTIITGFNNSASFDRRNPDRPNLKSGFSSNPTEGVSAGCGPIAAGTPVGTPDLWFDPCAFELNLQGTLGNLGRSTGRAASVVQLDFGVTKRFTVSEDVGVQFRAEFFNVLNRPNFAHPRSNVFQAGRGGRPPKIRSSIGRISRTVTDSRQIQFALKITF